MKKIFQNLCFAGILFIVVMNVSANPKQNTSFAAEKNYDMRQSLEPSRLTIAMWDFSWLYMHHKGGAFEDFEKATDELLERGFNTVRIDAFPLLIAQMKQEQKQTWQFPEQSQSTWGFITQPHALNIPAVLIEFMEITKRKHIFVILSSWGAGDRSKFSDRQKFWEAWEMTLDILSEQNLLDHVLYVDLDQEFPFFSPFQPALQELGKQPAAGEGGGLSEAMEAAGQAKWGWNARQMAFVKDYFNSTLRHFQKKYPRLRFTFSLTAYWDEIRSMKLPLDVLELHIWLDQDRFDARTGFNTLNKVRDDAVDYKAYMQSIRQTFKSIRPMLFKQLENRMQYAYNWSNEIPAPLVTTEAWGPWWHMDHPDLEWQWLYDWCEQAAALAENYSFWGITPWNFSHPYWENWSNISWYRRVNERFLNSR